MTSRSAWVTPLLIVLVATSVTAPNAGAITGKSIDLRGSTGMRVLGARTLVAAGDVNGDDTPDVMVASGFRAWIVFGRQQGRINLDDVSDSGFLIRGRRGHKVTIGAAGDVNGDGLDDVLVGVSTTSIDGIENAGEAFVVFGKATTSAVDLRLFRSDEQGPLGFWIQGSPSEAEAIGPFGGRAGAHLSSVGEINQDGFADIAVSAPYWGNLEPGYFARIYVVFGKANTDAIMLRDFDLGTQGTRGYRIDTPAPDNLGFFDISNAGDVNGDEVNDLVVGNVPSPSAPGSAFAIFGKSDPLPIDVRTNGAWGFRIRGAARKDRTGLSVDGANDTNGDGFDDLIVGTPHSVPRGRPRSAVVVYGKTSTEEVDLGSLGDQGFRIVSEKWWDLAASNVSGVGDTNGDGLADVAVSAQRADHNDRRNSGSIYVIYGNENAALVNVDRLHGKGFRIDGPRRDFYLGSAMDGGMDLDGDGFGDLWASNGSIQGLGGTGRRIVLGIWEKP